MIVMYQCPYCSELHDEPNADCCGEIGHVEPVEMEEEV